MGDAIGGLDVDGRLLVIGASMQPIEIPPLAIISSRRSIVGWPSGTSKDSEDTLGFSVLSAIRPMIETYPLERAAEAYERMMSGKARFRVVLSMDYARRPLIARPPVSPGRFAVSPFRRAACAARWRTPPFSLYTDKHSDMPTNPAR